MIKKKTVKKSIKWRLHLEKCLPIVLKYQNRIRYWYLNNLRLFFKLFDDYKLKTSGIITYESK